MSLYYRLICLAAGLLFCEQPSAHAETPRRDRHGDPLPPGAIARMGSHRLRHLDRAFQVEFSPDGKLMASCGADQRIRLWDAATGRQLRELAGHTNWVRVMAISPTGKLLASGGNEQTVRLWDIATGRQIGTPIPSTSNFVAFSPDGKTLAFQKQSVVIRLWDVATSKVAGTIEAKAFTDSAAFAPDGRSIATASNEHVGGPVIRLWDTATGRELWHARGDPRAVWSVAFSPDGKTLASGGGYWDKQNRMHGTIKLWDRATGKERRAFPELNHLVDFVRFSPDGKYLVSTCRLGPIVLWDWQAAEKPRRLWEASSSGSMGNAAFAPDSRRLAWCSGFAVHTIDLPPRKNRFALGGHTGPISFVAFSPNGKTVVSVGDTVRVWDAAGGAELLAGSAHFTQFSDAALRPDGRSLVTASREGIILWDLAGLKPLRSFASGDYASALTITPDGKTLIASLQHVLAPGEERGRLKAGTAIREDFLRLWDIDTGKETRRLGKGITAGHLAYTADGERLLAVQMDTSKIRIWDASNATLRASFAPESGRWIGRAIVRFSPDGKLLALGDWQGVIELRDGQSGKWLRTLGSPEGGIRTLSFSPDGKTLLSAGEDETLRLWDTATGKSLHELTGHRGAVSAAAFSSDGKRIASAGDDTTILIWDVPGLVTLVRKPPSLPTEDELNGLWIDLCSVFGYALSRRAMHRLTDSPQATVAFLKKRLKPDLPREERVERLLNDLDSDVFVVRQNASRELAKMDKRIEVRLRRALAERPSLEKRRRVEALLEKLPRPERQRSAWKPEELRLIRTVLVLDRIGTPDALELLHYLAHATELSELVKDRWINSWEGRKVKAALERRAKNGAAEPRP